MKNAARIEQEVLGLPPAARAQLALMAWESLAADIAFAASRAFDPEGIALAAQRDREIESGTVKPLTHKEFLRRTARADG